VTRCHVVPEGRKTVPGPSRQTHMSASFKILSTAGTDAHRILGWGGYSVPGILAPCQLVLAGGVVRSAPISVGSVGNTPARPYPTINVATFNQRSSHRRAKGGRSQWAVQPAGRSGASLLHQAAGKARTISRARLDHPSSLRRPPMRWIHPVTLSLLRVNEEVHAQPRGDAFRTRSRPP
jgi:hypothetical protein